MAPMPRRPANAPRAAKSGAEQSIMRISMPARHIVKKEKGSVKVKAARSASMSKATAGKAKREPTVKIDLEPEFRTKPGQLPFETYLLKNLTVKQQAGISKEFREKVNMLGQSLISLASAKKELLETDVKVGQLEETYGKTMKVQDLWRYQERAGLSAIIGQDPQAIMNVGHSFKDDERLMHRSGFPRARASSAADKTSPTRERSDSPRKEPPRTRTRAQLQMLIKEERLSTDDED